jgi:hypothetical protein
MTQDKLEHSVFARMPYSGRIVAGFDNLGMKLLVVGDVQFSFVIQESIEFFPLEKVVNQSTRAFFAKHFEGLGDFDFAIRAVSKFLFECRRLGEGSSGKCDEAFGVKNQLVPIVFGIRDLKASGARERIGDTIFLARLVN